MNAVINLVPIPPARLHELAGLTQYAGQYANDGAVMIRDDTPELSFHAIIDRERGLAGMFKLDPLYPERHDFADPTDLGLRGMLVDSAFQGLGIGGAVMAALPAYAGALYPEKQRLVLTVNLLNPIAYRTYRGAGFRDEGQIYSGGSRGPQHILWADLRPTERPTCSEKSSSPRSG